MRRREGRKGERGEKGENGRRREGWNGRERSETGVSEG